MNKKVCSCGCGTEIGLTNQWGYEHNWLRGHNNKHKSRVARTRNGHYYFKRCEGHPRARKKGNYVYEHVLVMEKHLGRYLTENELVHHINHNKLDNRIENLQLMTKLDHNLHHNPPKDTSDRSCLECKKKETYFYNGYYWWYSNPITKEKWVCRNCYKKLKGHFKK